MNGLSCNFPRVIKHTVACLLLTLLLGGCSTSFTYNHLDWLIPWYVDDYVDLSRDQKQFLKGELAPILEWHREEELVRYIAILDQVENDLTHKVTAETVNSWVEEVFAASERVEIATDDEWITFRPVGGTSDCGELLEATASRSRGTKRKIYQ